MIIEKFFNDRDFTRESEVKVFIDELITKRKFGSTIF